MIATTTSEFMTDYESEKPTKYQNYPNNNA